MTKLSAEEKVCDRYWTKIMERVVDLCKKEQNFNQLNFKDRDNLIEKFRQEEKIKLDKELNNIVNKQKNFNQLSLEYFIEHPLSQFE